MLEVDRETARWRQRAHEAFDKIWKRGIKGRGQAYKWLRLRLRLPKGQDHISKLSVEQCQELIEAVYKRWPELRPRNGV